MLGIVRADVVTIVSVTGSGVDVLAALDFALPSLVEVLKLLC